LTGQESGGADGPGSEPAPAGAEAKNTELLARVVFAVLVVACFAAFFVAQRLKHTPTVLQKIEMAGHFSPSIPGPHQQEAISFKLARADEVTITIIDSAGDTVATLLRDHPVVRYKQFSLRWNGRRGTATGYGVVKSPGGRSILVPRNRGALAPPGEYRVLVSLRSQHREVPLPRSFTLVGR
jgi:hypothetical protein